MKDKDKDMVLKFSKSLVEVKSRRPEDYRKKIEVYRKMKSGEDGGEFKKTGESIRKLHFPNWGDIHFQYLLEVLGEEEKITDEERKTLYKGSDSFFQKIINWFK